MSFDNQKRSILENSYKKMDKKQSSQFKSVKEFITTMYIQNMKPVHSALYSRNVQENINNSTRNKLWYWITGKHTER